MKRTSTEPHLVFVSHPISSTFRIPNSAFRLKALACGLSCLTLVGGCASRQVTVSIMPPLIRATPKAAVLFREPFASLDPARWREVTVQGHTTYTVVTLDGESCLMAQSDAGASILLSPVRFDPDKFEWLSWRWRVDRFVEGEDLYQKAGSDAAARLYVYFDTPGLPWRKRSLDYVWSASLPVGTILTSAHAHYSKIIVAESGTEPLAQWRTVTRNLEDDYRRCFGKSPPHVVAIGIMTDTDSTQRNATAYFDDLVISRVPGDGEPASPGSPP